MIVKYVLPKSNTNILYKDLEYTHYTQQAYYDALTSSNFPNLISYLPYTICLKCKLGLRN